MLPYYNAQNLFFADLSGKLVTIRDLPYIIFPILSVLLIWRIGKFFFKGNLSLIPPLIFLLSPWGWYLSFAHSIYIFYLFLTLSAVYGIILIKSQDVILGNVILSIAIFMAINSSSILFILIPLLILISTILKIISFNNIKASIIILVLFAYLPLFNLIRISPISFKSNLAKEVKIFSDPGLINSVNRYQGAATQVGLAPLARISENKYLFYSEYFALKYIDQLIPETFFTPQYKLLGFSFSPPIFLGFLIPFSYGLYKLLQKSRPAIIILALTILVIPSVLSGNLVSLNRLILFFPY